MTIFSTTEKLRQRWSFRVAWLCGLALALTGGVVLALRLYAQPFVAPVTFGGPPMHAVTAAALLVSGLLLCLQRPRAGQPTGLLRQRLAGAAALILLVLPAAFLLWSFGIDERPAKGFATPITILCFLCAGLAFFLATRGPSAGRASRALAALIWFVSLGCILGYAYGAPTLYKGIDGTTVMPLSVGVCLLLLATGLIWLQPTRGLAAILAAETVIGAQSRALLPMVIGPPLLVGGAVAAGSGQGLDSELAIALTSMGSVAAAALVGGLSLIVLNRSDSELTLKTRALNSAHNAIAILKNEDDRLAFVLVNDAFESMTRFAAADLRGHGLTRLWDNLPDEQPEAQQLLRLALSADAGAVELQCQRQDQTRFWARLSISPVFDRDDEATHRVLVMDDVTDERHSAQRLERALEDARVANHMRSAFVRLISHELRTPLNAALTWIRLMEVDSSGDTVARGMRVVEQSINTQSRLIDDLSDAARFESSGVDLARQSGDLAQIVATVVDELRPLAEQEHTLEAQLATSGLHGSFDAVRVQQMVRNLLTNAVKYTPAGGAITLKLRRRGDDALITVADTGRGLTPEQAESVFEPFWRAPSGQPGIGVGLFVVATLVAAHDGEVTVHSDGLGHGTRFEIRLPLDRSGGSPG